MRHRAGHEYESSSMISSDLETTSFVDSEEDASSRITMTTGNFKLFSLNSEVMKSIENQSQILRKRTCFPNLKTLLFYSLSLYCSLLS